MFSTFIRLGAALSCAAMLCSCGGNSIAETQQSTPEGLYTGTYTVTLTNPNAPLSTTAPLNPTTCTENAVTFVNATGSIYTFYPSANDASVLNAADEGTLTFSAGTMSSGILEVVSPGADPANATSSGPHPVDPTVAARFSATCDTFEFSSHPTTPPNTSPDDLAAASLTGGYNTGVNIAGTLTFTSADANGLFNTTAFNMPYDADYQGVQSLSTLAGTYNGIVSTSISAEQATFVISPASVPANAGNDLGVSILTGTGKSGCAYTGSVSPLFKGHGYSVVLTSGSSPCLLPNTSFSGLMYLNTKTNILYSFSPSQSRTDGLIFSGTRT